MSVGDRVQLVPEARSRFTDIGTRAGTVRASSHMIAVEWDGLDGRNWMLKTDLQEVA